MSEVKTKERKPVKRKRPKRTTLWFTKDEKQNLENDHKEYLNRGGEKKAFNSYLLERLLKKSSIIYKEKVGKDTFKLLNKTTNNLNQLLIVMHQAKNAQIPIDQKVLNKASECLDKIIDFTVENRA